MKKTISTLLFVLTMLFALSLTSLAANTGIDYTLVLQGGKTYKNTVTAANEVNLTGIYGASDGAGGYIYILNNFNFATSAATGVLLGDSKVTLKLEEGTTNKIQGGDVSGSGYAFGMKPTDDSELTIQGNGSLSVASGSVRYANSYGLGVGYKDFPVTVDGADVSFTGGSGRSSTGSYGAVLSSLTVKNNGKLKAMGNEGVGDSYGLWLYGNDGKVSVSKSTVTLYGKQGVIRHADKKTTTYSLSYCKIYTGTNGINWDSHTALNDDILYSTAGYLRLEPNSSTVRNPLSAIAVIAQPAKTVYFENESFDKTGMVVLANNLSVGNSTITDYTILRGSKLVAGQTSVIVSYTDSSITRTVAVPITVKTEIPQVAITNVAQPEVGAIASFNYGISSYSNFTKTPSASGGSTMWLELSTPLSGALTETTLKNAMSSGTVRYAANGTFTFNADKYYVFIANINAKDSYGFRSGGVTATVNTKAATAVVPGLEYGDMNVAYYFGKPLKFYDVTVSNGTANPARAQAGLTVTLTANAAPEGQDFDKWLVFSGNITFSDATSATTTFTMPASEVSIVAAYKTHVHLGGTATCTEKAVCTSCGMEYGDILPHTVAAPKVKSATCTEAGYTTHTCEVCGYSYIDGEVEALGHDYTAQVTEDSFKRCDATCTSLAEYYFSCTRCGESCEGDTNRVFTAGGTKPHTEVALKAKAATCTATGLTEGKKCSVCGEVTVAQETVAKTAHTEVALKAKAATCTATGLTAGKKCSVCGKVTVAQKSVAKKAHSYKTTTTKATTSKDGSTVKKCTVCGTQASKTAIYKVTSFKLSATSYTYNGSAKTPSVTVKDSKGKTLKKDTDYTVKYASGRKSVGKYTVTVTLKGKYSGTKSLSFTINPKATSKITVTQTTTSIKATWSKVSGATGYKVYLYKGSTLVASKTVSAKTTSYNFTKLTAGTNYTVKVKAYQTVSKVNYWSSTKSLATATKTSAPSVSVKSSAKKAATVSWKKVSGATSYAVYYSASKNGTYKKLATVTGTSYTYKKLTSGKTAYFKVIAVKTVGSTNINSAYSAVKSVKVK